MYDINKFLEDRVYLYNLLKSKDLTSAGDNKGTIYIEKNIDGHTLFATLNIEITEYKEDCESVFVEVLESCIFTREEDEIELTNEQNEVIINVIKSLL